MTPLVCAYRADCITFFNWSYDADLRNRPLQRVEHERTPASCPPKENQRHQNQNDTGSAHYDRELFSCDNNESAGNTGAGVSDRLAEIIHVFMQNDGTSGNGIFA